MTPEEEIREAIKVAESRGLFQAKKTLEEFLDILTTPVGYSFSPNFYRPIIMGEEEEKLIKQVKTMKQDIPKSLQ